jgi:hypothetical protein
VDHIAALQNNSDEHAAKAIVETARMAPEVFAAPLIEYCFKLLEDHRTWFYEPGLDALDMLDIDSQRLVRCALHCLGEHRATNSAAKVVQGRSAELDWDLVPAGMPVLAYQAHPSHLPIGGEASPRPDALLAVFDASPHKTVACLELVAERNAYGLERAARAVIALCEAGRQIPEGMGRVLAARAARLDRILEDEARSGDVDELEHLLRLALAALFEQDPEAIDSIMQGFLEGAREPGQVQLFAVYRTVIRFDRWMSEREVGPAHSLALKRLIEAATRAVDHDVLAELRQAFDHPSDELLGLMRHQAEGLLGAALILDDRRTALLEKGKVEHTNPLVEMERDNQWRQIGFLIGRLISAAAQASAGDQGAAAKYLSVLQGIPESKDQVKAELLKEGAALAETADCLALALPSLYSCLVGRSTRMRAAAADFVEKLDWRRRSDLPDLVLEALVMQLTDPYRLVHQCAFDAIESVKLPESLDRKAKAAIFNLLLAYSQEGDIGSGQFLVKCIRSVLGHIGEDERVTKEFGEFLIEKLKRTDPYLFCRDLRFLSRRLGHHPEFASLLVNLASHADRESWEDDYFDALDALDSQLVRAHRGDLATAALNWEEGHLHFIEVFTKAGLWDDAVGVSRSALTRIPETRWMRARKMSAAMNDAAVRFEAAIAAGDEKEIRVVAKQWREIAAARAEAQRDDNEKNGNPFGHLLGED